MLSSHGKAKEAEENVIMLVRCSMKLTVTYSPITIDNSHQE